jgi:hypothetical protein
MEWIEENGWEVLNGDKQGDEEPVHTGCLMKNASTHNFSIYYPISMNKKIKDMVFQALQNSHKIYFFALSSIANDSQLFFFKWTRSFLGLVW